MIVLGIDTSCDDTSCAILEDRKILSDIVSSQVELHRIFGGVVPEIASRKHAEIIDRIFFKALEEANVHPKEIDIIGVTNGPGLPGSLLVGLSFAKGLCLSLEKPLVAINHVHAHAMSIFLETDIEFPYIALVVSGGHTMILFVKNFRDFEVMGTTRDDAAGEAFDKIAKFFGLPYPGGKIIEEISRNGKRDYVYFTRPMIEEKTYDFSFSGLKTALINYVKKNGFDEISKRHILASFEEAIVDVLVTKTIRAARDRGVKRIVLGGGVSANERLREVFLKRCNDEKIHVLFPSKRFCLDNGSMVAITTYFLAKQGYTSPIDVPSFSRMNIVNYDSSEKT